MADEGIGTVPSDLDPAPVRDRPDPLTGLGSALLGAVLVVIGGSLLANTIEEPDLFRPAGLLFLSFGFFFLVSAAVARGTERSRT